MTISVEELALRNHQLIQSLGADMHAMRAALFALAMQSAADQLLQSFDAATTVVLAKKQGEALPDDYLDLLEAAFAGLRAQLQTAATGVPAAQTG